MLASRSTEYASIWHPNNIDNQLYLFSFICSWEQGEPSKQLNHDAAKTPHINLLRVGEDTEHDIRSPVKSTLDIGVDNLILQTATAKVSNHNATLVLLLHEDILWLQITMDDAKPLQISQT